MSSEKSGTSTPPFGSDRRKLSGVSPRGSVDGNGAAQSGSNNGGPVRD